MVGAAIKMNRAFCSVARHDEMQLRKGDFNSHPREVSPEVIVSCSVFSATILKVLSGLAKGLRV